MAVIPARNEESTIARAVESLLRQDYPGSLRLVVVDDCSEDRTAAAARDAALLAGRPGSLALVAAEPLPAGWTGKVWAMQQGLTRGIRPEEPAEYVLFTDADVQHGSDTLRQLVSRAEACRCDLVSLMVRLSCRSAAERLMIPAFVFFFRLLYPFRRVNDPADKVAGAAGGVMLVRRSALIRVGGLERIRAEVIDDCALASAVKRGGHRIWLGLGQSERSLREYARMSDIVSMIARTAYTQLAYSPLSLVVSVVGLALAFAAPPALALFGHGAPRALGGAAWALMALLYLPMVRFYRQSPVWAPLLPVTALLYLCATVLSAWRHHCGRGGWWKGRSQSAAMRW